MSQTYPKDASFHATSLHVWKARFHCLEILKSLALILTGKGPTQLKEVLEFFVRV